MTTTDAEGATGVIVTAVATSVPDIESAAAYDSSYDENAGKSLGIAMFVLLVVGFIFNFLVPLVSAFCIIIVICMSSTITCCAGDFNLKPHVKRWSTLTLLCLVLMLVLMFVVQIIGIIGVAASSAEVSNTGTISQSTVDESTTAIYVVLALSVVLNFLAMVFTAIFTWGRGCCAPSS